MSRYRQFCKYTDELKEYINSIYKGRTVQEVARLVNARFDIGITPGQISSYKKRNKLRSGVDTRFKKGQPSYNKGKKPSEYMSPESYEKIKKNWFPKGHKPHNSKKPIGTLSLRLQGNGSKRVWYEKLGENKWKPKHRLEWERAYGPVPKGCVICFVDGNTENWHLDNLILCSMRQNAIKNAKGIRVYDRESIEAANALADLVHATRNRKESRYGKKETV
jgi:hypothetical protein